MRSDFNSKCRRKEGDASTSQARIARLQPHSDGDIRKFVVKLSSRARLPREVIEPFVENNHRLKQRFRSQLQALEGKVQGALHSFEESMPESGQNGDEAQTQLLDSLDAHVRETLLNIEAEIAKQRFSLEGDAEGEEDIDMDDEAGGGGDAQPRYACSACRE